jgi:hypothetical protein
LCIGNAHLFESALFESGSLHLWFRTAFLWKCRDSARIRPRMFPFKPVLTHRSSLLKSYYLQAPAAPQSPSNTLAVSHLGKSVSIPYRSSSSALYVEVLIVNLWSLGPLPIPYPICKGQPFSAFASYVNCVILPRNRSLVVQVTERSPCMQPYFRVKVQFHSFLNSALYGHEY